MTKFDLRLTLLILAVLALVALLPQPQTQNGLRLTTLWDAPDGFSQQAAARAWLGALQEQWAHQPAICPDGHPPRLDPDQMARAYQVQYPESTPGRRQIAYLREPVAESFILVGTDHRGCPWSATSGRAHEFGLRHILSPFPNTALPDSLSGSLTVVIQDRKTIRPWIFVEDEEFFIREVNTLWMMLGGMISTLAVTSMITLVISRVYQSRLMLRYVLYLATFLVWSIQNYGLGAQWAPLLSNPAWFPYLQGLAVACVNAGIGLAVIEFLGLRGRARRLLYFSMALAGFSFLSSAPWDDGYKIGAAAMGFTGLYALGLLVVQLRGSTADVKLFALGLACTMAGGAIQGFSVLDGFGALTDMAVYAFTLGNFTQVVCWLVAISLRILRERSELMNQLIRDANYDPLTGLPNRFNLAKQLQEILQHPVQTPPQRMGLLFLGVDRLKNINDNLGHSVGDQLLLKTAERIAQIGQQHAGVTARFGGDEFVILIERLNSEHALQALAQGLTDAFREPLPVDGRELQVGVTIGGIAFDPLYPSAEAVLRDADTALSSAKRRGRGRVEFFNPLMREAADRRFRLEADLISAVRRQTLALHYQPIVRLSDSYPVGFEALARWHHPQAGSISPAEFVPIAEEIGLVRDMGLHIMDMAMHSVRRWKDQGLWRDGWYVSINLSAGQLEDDSLLFRIDSLQARHGLRPQDFRIELTETAVIESMDMASRLLPALRERGVGLCLDDFGTGYSSLSYLSQLPFDAIKIDKSFIDALSTDATDQALVRTILLLAHEMRLGVVAEGVEQAEQAEKLRQIGCRFGQGYLFSRPLDPAQATEWLGKALLLSPGPLTPETEPAPARHASRWPGRP